MPRQPAGLKPGLEKTRVFFKKKPAQWFFLGFLVFFVFFGFFCPEERVLEFFSVSRILLGFLWFFWVGFFGWVFLGGFFNANPA